MHALLRSVFLLAFTTAFLLVGAHPATTSAKDDFTYFAEAFNFVSTDAAGFETHVEVTGIDRPTTPNEVSLSISRVNPACSTPEAGCPYVLFSGDASGPVAEEDVRIQSNVQWARVATTITFVDQISGISCAAIVDITWRSTSEFFPDGNNPPGAKAQGFRKANAAGTITCAGEEFLGGQVDSNAEIARFILAS